MADSAINHLAGETGISPAFLDETRRHDPAALFEAGRSIRAFDARPWVGTLACPAVSIVTERDRLVARRRQIELPMPTAPRSSRWPPTTTLP
jgi:hypothetical protein